MSEKLYCPDCGGVLGVADVGEATCSCFTNQSVLVSSPSGSGSGSGSGDLMSSGETLSDTQPVEVVTKICNQCGIDVNGRKRYKDSRGYLCAECNQKEIDAEKEGTALCPECGRRVRHTALSEFRGRMICKLCMQDLRDTDKKRIKVISSKNFETNDKRNLMVMIGILAVLGIFILISAIKILSGHF